MTDSKHIARALEDQPTWKNKGLPDLRALTSVEPSPPLLPGADSVQQAVRLLRQALGVAEGGWADVETPAGPVRINDASLPHVVEKRQDQRERFAHFVLPTLRSPNEVWSVKYDYGSRRNRYIRLFGGSKYDLLVMVKVEPDGSVFWNMMQRDRKGMNAFRTGELIFKAL